MAGTIKERRNFFGKFYRTDKVKYDTKEVAREHIEALKEAHEGIIARIVPKKGFTLVYVEEGWFARIHGDEAAPGEATPPKTKAPREKPPKRKKSAAKETTKKKATATRKKTTTRSAAKTKKAPAKKKTAREKATKTKKTAAKRPPAKKKASKKKATKKKPNKSAANAPTESTPPAPAPEPEKTAKAGHADKEDLDRYYAPPTYLFERLTKDGTKAVRLGVLQIQHLPLKKLVYYYDVLGTEKIKFDAEFDKEREFLEHIDHLMDIIQARRNELYEEVARAYITERVEGPMDAGKFDKILAKLGPGYGPREISYDIFDALKRARKKWPFGEPALRKEIRRLVKRKFPAKCK